MSGVIVELELPQDWDAKGGGTLKVVGTDSIHGTVMAGYTFIAATSKTHPDSRSG